jgi:hypothetical protein
MAPNGRSNTRPRLRWAFAPWSRSARRAAKRRRGKAKARLVCSAPVFGKGSGATDNSLIGTNRSLIAENNYGYSISSSDLRGGARVPGLARIDVVKKKRGEHSGRKRKSRFRCRTV